MPYSISIIFALSICCFEPIWSQNSPIITPEGLREITDTVPTQLLKEYVVSANRVATDPLNAPEAVQRIPAKSIPVYSPRSTPDALATLPGVFMQKSTHGAGSAFIRGLTGNQTLLLLDGIRLNNAVYRYGPNQYLNTVDLFSLQNLEVLRGSGSVQYGSDALGGTIQLFTKSLELSELKTWQGLVTGRWWSQEMEKSIHAESGFSNTHFTVAGGYTYRDFGDLVAANGPQNPSGYKEQAFDLKSKIKLNKLTHLTLAHNQVAQHHVPLFYKVQLENFNINEFDPQFRQLSYARLDFQSPNASGLKSWYLIASRQHTDEGRRSQKIGANIMREERDQVATYGVSTNLHFIISKHWQINSGLEAYYDQVDSKRNDLNLSTGFRQNFRGLYPDGAGMLSLAAFSLHEITWQKWRFHAGARATMNRLTLTDPDLGAVVLKPSALVWSGALQRMLSTEISLFGSYHSGFRSPNIDDLGTLGIVDFRYEVPNYTLKPERSHNFQVGFKSHAPRFQTEIYLFRNELRELITRTKTSDSLQGYAVYQKENIERAYIQGLEAQFNWKISAKWQCEGHFNYTFGQNLTRQEPVRRIPPANGRFALRFQPLKRFYAIGEFLQAGAQHRLAQGDKDDNRIPEGGTPGWSVVNFFAGYNGNRWQVQSCLHNLFNQQYRMHGSGIDAAGRSVDITLTYQISLPTRHK